MYTPTIVPRILRSVMSQRVASTLLVALILIGDLCRNVVVAVSKPPIIGIDLGTTYSCVAVLRGDQVEIIPNPQGDRTTPSWVAILPSGERLVGQAAKTQAPSNPENTIFDSKRMIGRKFDDAEVQHDVPSWPFKVLSKSGNPAIEVNVKGEKKQFAPEEISAMVLSYMREAAESFLGVKIDSAVITVPAYFTDAQRQATKDAGQIAGLKVERLINEPTAAAIAYGLDLKGESKILVYDLGGGTFDISMLQVEDGVFEVKAVNGDGHLGGQDFDNNVMAHIGEQIHRKTGVKVEENKRLKGKLRAEVERGKRVLSMQSSARIELDGVGGGDFSMELTRAKFEELNMPLFQKTIDLVGKALKDAKWAKKDVDHIVLVGGSTRIIKVQQMLKEYFNGKEPSRGVNPDEAVAYGAALQAGVIMGHGKTEDLLVIDATPLTLGIETQHGIFTSLISRNSPIPARKSQIFSTAGDNQSTVRIQVFEGEREFTKDNHLLGSFELTGIPSAPRGVPQIEVTFEVDVNGILTVEAHDKGSGNKQSIKIKNDKGRLSKEQIEKMLEEAEKFKAEDRARKEVVEARDDFERYVYSLKQQLGDEKITSKLSSADKEAMKKAVAEANDFLDDHRDQGSKDDFEAAKQKLENAVSPIVKKLYEGATAEQDATPDEAKADKEEL
jgi:heat shock protein 5